MATRTAKRLVIELEWNGPGGGAEFIVERSKNDRRFEEIATVNARRYRDDAVELGQKYEYRVRTLVVDDVPSRPSEQVAVSLDAGELVEVPSGLRATVKARG